MCLISGARGLRRSSLEHQQIAPHGASPPPRASNPIHRHRTPHILPRYRISMGVVKWKLIWRVFGDYPPARSRVAEQLITFHRLKRQLTLRLNTADHTLPIGSQLANRYQRWTYCWGDERTVGVLGTLDICHSAIRAFDAMTALCYSNRAWKCSTSSEN